MVNRTRSCCKSHEKLSVRVTEAEAHALRQVADQHGLTLSQLIRLRLLREAEVASRPSPPAL